MNPIDKMKPCPAVISQFICRSFAATQLRYTQKTNWFKRQLMFVQRDPRRGETVADVRWFSECNIECKDCSGVLLSRWLIWGNGIEPLAADLAPEAPDEDSSSRNCIDDPLFCMVYDFGITPQQDKCVIIETDLDGHIQRAAYQLPDGISGTVLGPMIGEAIHEKFKRDKWDPCVPKGWRPRPNAGETSSDL